MTYLQKCKSPLFLKWVCCNFKENNIRSSNITFWAHGAYQFSQTPRFYSAKKAIDTTDDVSGKVSLATMKAAQGALLEYLHSTRNLQFMDAENMSRNSPLFLKKLVKRFEGEENIGRSVTRFLRYHPINEFELFFESSGLSPSEYSSLLPRDLMFLNDDKLLLENYIVLCNYGLPRNRIGKIYKEATEAFQYDYGVLKSKLRSFEEVGLSKSTVIKVVASSPDLLVKNEQIKFFEVLGKLKDFGIEYDWIGQHLLESDSYDWSHILGLLCLLSQMGYTEVQLGSLIFQHPGLLFECSGTTTFSLIGFLLKFGNKPSHILSVLQSQQNRVWNHLWNLRQCYHFLNDAEMEVHEIGRIVRSHPVLLGSCSLKKLNSLLVCLNTGKSRLCRMIIEDPLVLKNWVHGSRVKKLKAEESDPHAKRTKFLLDLGFVKNSSEMRKALKAFRGKAGELQERFDYLVNLGLHHQDVLAMVKIAPQILNMTKDVLEMKIDFLVSGIGYPISTLLVFPAYVSYTIKRLNLRVSMYNWLVDQGAAEPNLALSTVVACPEKVFIKTYVNSHPKGREIWEEFKKDIQFDYW